MDLPSAHPGRVSKASFHTVWMRPFPIWVAVNTRGRFKAGAYRRWQWRRGALHLYWRMYSIEYKRRAAFEPDSYYYPKAPLKISNLRDSQVITKRQDHRYVEGIIIPPGNAAVSKIINSQGRLTKEGLAELDDKEFVWPYLDVACPNQPMFTELMVAKQWERVWMEHYYGHDAPPPPLEVGGHIEPTFALVYARYLRALGRAGPGTKLGRWLDAWLERAEAEENRLAQIGSQEGS